MLTRFEELVLAKCHYCGYKAKDANEESYWLFFGQTAFCTNRCLEEYAGVDKGE